ncbi:MAG: ribosome maturation factor RimM [Alphaproteobacteria bacterium]
MTPGKDHSGNTSEPGQGAVCVGVITGAKGVKGQVRIKSFTEDPAKVAAYGPVSDEAGRRQMQLKVEEVSKATVTARIAGIDDRTAAEALKGCRLYVDRDRLPQPQEDEFYYCDLIGLDAILPDGEKLGPVCAVHNFGAGDVLEIDRMGDKGTVMVPFTRQVVPVIDFKARVVRIEPPEGLLDTGTTPRHRKGEDK